MKREDHLMGHLFCCFSLSRSRCGRRRPLARWAVSAVALPLLMGWAFAAGAQMVDISPATQTVQEGAMPTYTVTLSGSTAPTANVTVTASSDNTDATFLPGNNAQTVALTFEMNTWNTAQTVSMTVAVDMDGTTDSATISHAVDSTDTTYSALNPANHVLTINENMVPTFSGMTQEDVTYTFGTQFNLTLPEASGGDGMLTYTLTPPIATAVSNDFSFNATARTISGTPTTSASATLTYTASDADNITGASDEASLTFMLSRMPEVQVIPASIGEITSTTSSPYRVRLLAPPTGGSVTVTPSSDNTAYITLPPATALTFTTTNWNTQQTVMITAMDDADALPNPTVTISHMVTAATGANYNGVTAGNVTASASEDDMAGVDISSISNVVEDASGEYGIRLNSAPAGMATVTATNSNSAAATINPTSLTFTTTNWDTYQRITVTGVADADAIPDTTTITHAVTGYSEFSGTPESHVIEVEGQGVAGITVSPAALTIAENGMRAYTVVLDSAPADNTTATITPSRGTSTDATVTPTVLSFTTTNWNMEQTVTVSGVSDADANVPDTVTITHAVANYEGITSVFPNYGTLHTFTTADPVRVTITENNMRGVDVSPTARTVAEGSNSGAANVYTVELESEPVGGDVTITPSSGDTDVATVVPAELTFTGTNWDTAQTLTITGVMDADAIPDPAISITHTVAGADYGSNNVTADPVTVTVTENDTAMITVGTIGNVAEGASGMYSVTLSSAPMSMATITPSSSDVNVATVSGALIFSTSNWDTPQMVTVTGVEDPDAIPDDVVTVTLGVMGYMGITALGQTMSTDIMTAMERQVTVIEDDTAGVTISAATLTIAEDGMDVYTVVLDSAPADNTTATITPSRGAFTDATFAPAVLSFTTTNWNMAQTVTVDGVDDADAVVPTTPVTLTHAVANYEGITTAGDHATRFTFNTADPVTVAITETDTAMINVGTIGNVAEGGSGMYSVALTSAPGAGMMATITPTSSDENVATVSDALTFSLSNWNMAQSITVTGEEDDDAIPDLAVTITLGVMGYMGITASGQTMNTNIMMAMARQVTVVEDDTAGVTISETALSLDEGSNSGASNTYTVVLDSAPETNVLATVTPTSSDVNVATVSAALIFSHTNWDMEQTVTLTGVQDEDAHPDAAISVTHGVGGYEGVTVANDVNANSVDITTANAVTVTVLEDDVGRVIITSDDPLALDENGLNTYTVTLNSAPGPSGMATVTPSSGDVAVATVSGALTFTDANWNTAQTVTVSGVMDDDAIPDMNISISHAVAGYRAVTTAGDTTAVDIGAGEIAADVAEDDVAGVSVGALRPSPVREAGMSTYTVVLLAAPMDGGMAVVTPSSSDPTKITVSDALTFTPTDWNTTQTVTVTSLMDDNAVDEMIDISHMVSGYMGITAGDETVAVPITTAGSVGATVGDNGTSGVVIFSGDPTTPPDTSMLMNMASRDTQIPVALELFEGETGDSNLYYVVLASQPSPAGAVVVTPSIDSSDNAEATVSDALTFTAENWNTAQTVTISDTDDDNGIDGMIVISHTVTSTGTDYENVANLDIHPPANVTVNVTDAQNSEALAAVNEVILPEVAHALAVGQVTAIANRIQQAGSISGGATVPSFNFGGQTTLADMAARHAQTLADDDMDMKRLLGDSDFAMPLNAHGGNGIGGSTLAFWGGGDYRSLGGKSGATEWDGDMFSIQLGLDTRLRPGLLGGLMVTYSETDIDYKAPPSAGAAVVAGAGFAFAAVQEGEYEVEITSLNPYLSWGALDGKLDLWATLGYGDGEVTLTPDANAGNPSTSDLTTQTLGLGGSGQLLASEDGITELRLNLEGFHTTADIEGAAADGGAAEIQALQVDASRYRLLLEATRTHTTANGATVKPSIEAGARYDGGDGETGTGFEVGGGVLYRNPASGMTLEGRVRGLLSHSADYEEWGISGRIRLENGADGQGLSVSLAPRYGNPESGMGGLWNNGLRDTGTAEKDNLPGFTLSAKAGYGLPAVAVPGMVTPYSAMNLGQTEQTYRLGLQWELHKLFDLNLFAKRHEKDNEATDHAIQLEGEVSF